jgi:hypothetical protein
LENVSGNVYLKMDDVWVNDNINLKGIQGPQGSQGPPGENGRDANAKADVEGLLEYSEKMDSSTNYYCLRYVQTVIGFLVNFGTENAENVVIHITLENVSDKVLFMDNILVGELKGHELCAINRSEYRECKDV